MTGSKCDSCCHYLCTMRPLLNIVLLISYNTSCYVVTFNLKNILCLKISTIVLNAARNLTSNKPFAVYQISVFLKQQVSEFIANFKSDCIVAFDVLI